VVDDSFFIKNTAFFEPGNISYGAAVFVETFSNTLPQPVRLVNSYFCNNTAKENLVDVNRGKSSVLCVQRF
jgi:uncharacterized HAD superfamily protein